ncbi:hypothetical protein ABH976_007581 [Bradyrhizobium ottawaense]|uniref:DUF6946 family protein n=1 Tax=Bradyrhizobium ottawaense TaxID=931866 RepID=UPI0035149F63
MGLPGYISPMRRPEDVIPYLGSPGHWQDGRSAKLVAESWFAAKDRPELSGLPEMVRVTLARCPPGQVSRFVDVQLVDAFVERCTELGDGSTPSQTDVLTILRLSDEIAVMAVEGKVDESFGPRVSEWLHEAAPTSKKAARLKRLAQTLGIDLSGCENLRYQLLHRTAAALYEAHRYHAKVAVMMVHSFDPKDSGFEDFARLGMAMGMAKAVATRLIGPVSREGVDLYLGWTADRSSNEGYVVLDGRKTDAGFFDND